MDSPVNPSDPFGDGGTILRPERISEDIVFRIRFREDGSAQIQRIVKGAVQGDPQIGSCFAGLRDDPFIRGPRQGRNVAAIVLEVPLSSVVSGQDTLLLWATSQVKEFDLKLTGAGKVTVTITVTPPQPNVQPKVTRYQFDVK